MQRKRAFTLIELLVVIAIIAILAAILFPVFAKARESARKTKSLNNIKQLAIAVTMYSQDYNETFPGWYQPTATTFAHNVWDEQINSQVKAKDAFNNGETGIPSWVDPAKTRRLTYGLNGLLIAPRAVFNGDADFGSVSAANPPAPSSPGAIGNPSGTILFAELATNAPLPAPYANWIDISPKYFCEFNVANDPLNYNDPWKKIGANAITDFGVARDLYSGGGVYAFCDSHAQFMKIGKSVGMGLTYLIGTAPQTVTTANCWDVRNTTNMWNPQ